MKFIKLGLVAAALMTVSGVSLAQQKDIKIVDPRESPYVIESEWRCCHEPVWPVLANRFLEP